jgi:hypothetical protein
MSIAGEPDDTSEIDQGTDRIKATRSICAMDAREVR